MKQLLYFSLGVVGGAFMGHLITKRYYEDIVDAEIESVKEAYSDDYSHNKSREKKIEEKIEAEYVTRSTLDIAEPVIDPDLDNIEHEEFPMKDREQIPYVIGPDEWGDDYHSFDKETIIYWAGNKCLMTEDGECLDIESIIGSESLRHVGEYEDNTVFVRNERLGTDYEVLYEEGEYFDE